jgi:co-chaperonin GroES (HSP10)
MKGDMKVHGYRILVKAIESEEKTKSGLYLSDSFGAAMEMANVGVVVDMGEQAYLPADKFGGAPFCKVGDIVVYSYYEREKLTIDKDTYYFLNDEKILATISPATLVKMYPTVSFEKLGVEVNDN